MEISPPSPSRRTILSAAAVTVSLPLVEAALGHVRSAQAAATTPARGGPAEKPGFFDTTLKPADVKDKEFTVVKGHKVLLVRQGDNITAITNVCTHRGCTVTPTAGLDVMTCGCHKAQYNLDGGVVKGPATVPLNHYAVKLNGTGTIEVDPGQILAKDAKEAVLVSKASAAPAA